MASVLLFQGEQGSAVRLLASPGGTGGTVSVPSVVGSITDKDGRNVFEPEGGGGGTGTKGIDNLFTDFFAIITGFEIEEVANANAMYAADGKIYMHVPGDKLGAMSVSGITFASVCNINTSNQPKSGLVRMLEWYRKYRISNPQSGRIKITLTGLSEPLEGYLGSFSSRVMDISNHIYSFTLPMYLVPGDVG